MSPFPTDEDSPELSPSPSHGNTPPCLKLSPGPINFYFECKPEPGNELEHEVEPGIELGIEPEPGVEPEPGLCLLSSVLASTVWESPPPPPLVSNFQGSTLYLNESGLYSLIFGSKLESAEAFKRWVTKDVLPSIRKTGRYSYDDMNHKYNNMLTFKIENETDLHVKVVSFLKKRYPHSLFTVTLGENQDTVHKRIDSFNKGYLRGSPDLIINNLHKNYTGFCIEFKSPKGNGVL